MMADARSAGSRFDGRSVLRSAAVLVGVFILIGVPSALLLGHAFFEDWGFVVGPAAWVVGAVLAARSVGLGVGHAFLGSLAAIVPNAVAGALGLHWVGVALGVAVFACFCGWAAAARTDDR